MISGRSSRFFKNDCHGVSFTTSPKHPQSSTGIKVALRKVMIVKIIIEAVAKVEHIRILTLKSNIHPIISSAPHNHMENIITRGLKDSSP
jgi:hypothetical protein